MQRESSFAVSLTVDGDYELEYQGDTGLRTRNITCDVRGKKVRLTL